MDNNKQQPKDDGRSCRNCLSRFGCESIPNDNSVCQNYEFDTEAATCDDCSLKESCGDYRPNHVTCEGWSPITTCDECVTQGTCPNFREGGRTCDKFKEIRYRITEKGVFYLALDTLGADTHVLDTDFFDVFEHEVKINRLVEGTRMAKLHRSRIGRFLWKVLHLFKKKPETSIEDIFKTLAKKPEYYRYFGESESTVDTVWDTFAKMLVEYYAKG